MPRYFITTDAARPVVTAVATYKFEQVLIRGGAWTGVLAVDDPVAAGALAALTNIGEISETRFNDLKKKDSMTPGVVNGSRQQPPPSLSGPGLTVAEVAGRPISRPSGPPADVNAPILTPVMLATTERTPPIEASLQGPGSKRRRF